MVETHKPGNTGSPFKAKKLPGKELGEKSGLKSDRGGVKKTQVEQVK